MAWTDQWTITVDGNGLNTRAVGGPYITFCPEVGFTFEQDAILAPVDGDYPVLVRLQPREGRYTFYIQMTSCDWATYQTREAQLRGWLSPGTHTFAFQVQGMAAPKSVVAAVTSFITSPKERRVVVSALAAKPVLV